MFVFLLFLWLFVETRGFFFFFQREKRKRLDEEEEETHVFFFFGFLLWKDSSSIWIFMEIKYLILELL